MKVVDKTKHKQQKKDAKNGGKHEESINQDGCCIPMIECVKPSDPLPQTAADGIKFDCSNPNCLFAKQFAHPECMDQLEKDLLILLRSHGDARGWPEEKLMLAFKKVWRRKGSTFLQSSIKCKCGKGVMMRDEDAWEKRKAIVEPEPEKKEKKKAKPKALPELQHKGTNPKLDHHWMSSRSPPPSTAFLEDKYGPVIKPPKRTRKETDNSMTSSNDTNLVKKRVPIGFAPIDSKPDVQKQKSEEPQPKPANNNAAVPPKLPESGNAWLKVDRHHRIEPDLETHDVEEQMPGYDRVVSEEPSNNLQENINNEEAAKEKENPWKNPVELKESFKVSATPLASKFVTIAVQTDETCFPNNEISYKQYRNRNAMVFRTDEGSSLSDYGFHHGFDSGINSSAGSPKIFGDSYQRNSNFGDSSVSIPPGFGTGRLKKLSISEKPARAATLYHPPPPAYPSYSQVNFLIKDNFFAVEFCHNGKREMIKNAFDNEWTPMYISMVEKTPEIGQTAQSQSNFFPKYVIYDIMKIIGRSLDELEMNPKWGFELVIKNGMLYFQVETANDTRLFSQEIIVAAFFKTMKAQAESYLNTTVKEICLVTDYELNDSQKSVFKGAASKLNFDKIYFKSSL